ncbi:hypothetical protein MMC26_003821 [Xylographa opegraphella]|nr:hypothetical protein [Xylographa opegraphella]
MAIYPSRSTGPRGPSAPSQETQPINIETWTAEAAPSLRVVSLVDPASVLGASAPLAIPLDEHAKASHRSSAVAGVDKNSNEDADGLPTTPHRKLLRRDSLDRRNALLKGKEGSRRRQRWENDHLLSNPHAVPPLPLDFSPHPTHPHRSVPYFLAPLWDVSRAQAPASKPTTPHDPKAHIPSTLRATLKRAKAAKGLLQDLEESVRHFVAGWERKQAILKAQGLHDVGDDSEDEEIVFVGRGGAMLDVPDSPPRGRKGREDDAEKEEEEEEEEVRREKLVFESAAEDRGASFGRWLVHSIATYYDLKTWSVTVGDPARREAYVGIKLQSGGLPVGEGKAMGEEGLPRPLWGMV